MNVPERGFYYHFKHDPKGAVNEYAYEVIGTGIHTEDKTLFVVYLPLYGSTYTGNHYAIRPLEMFMEEVTRDGKTMPRFKKITDQNVINQLVEVRSKMNLK